MASNSRSTPPGNYQLPSIAFKNRMLILGSFVGTLALVFAAIRTNPFQIFFELDQFARVIGEMLPPNLKLLINNPSLYDSMGETVSMAFLGTVVGSSISATLSFLAARNTTPHATIRFVIRTLFSMERSIPEFAVVLILIAALGAGPFAAMLTLCIATIGFTGKLFADAVEHIDPIPLESLQVSGARRSQVIRFGTLPQVMPSFISTLFYAFDINIRRSVALGIFGGGGIGYELELSTGMLKYKDMIAYIIGIVLLVAVMERVSDWIRQLVIGSDRLLR